MLSVIIIQCFEGETEGGGGGGGGGGEGGGGGGQEVCAALVHPFIFIYIHISRVCVSARACPRSRSLVPGKLGLYY